MLYRHFSAELPHALLMYRESEVVEESHVFEYLLVDYFNFVR